MITPAIGIPRVVFYASNYEDSRAFYEETLGLEKRLEWDRELGGKGVVYEGTNPHRAAGSEEDSFLREQLSLPSGRRCGSLVE